MILITSLSPSHLNASSQKEALKSWQQYGLCLSMNNAEEIKILKNENYEGIHFLETNKTIEHYVNKPLVMVHAMMDIARIQGKDLFIVNSDIEIDNLPELKQDGITIFSRYDWSELHTKANAQMFVHGFDAFYIPKQFLKIFPPSIFAMGASHWDHWLPYHAILKNVPVYYPKGKFIFHKIHGTQYPLSEWYRMGKLFRWHFNLDEKVSIEQIATNIMRTIKSKLISY